MKNVGIMGGTFDPIHIGHLITATFIKEEIGFDSILFIPCYISPLKTDIKSLDSFHRLNMLKLAIEDISYFEYSDIELQNKQVSYTYNTLLKLKNNYSKLNLIIGYDNYAVFDKWYNPEGILELANVYVLNRQINKNQYNITHHFGSKFTFIENPIIEISASEIRRRIKTGKDISFYVPEKVKDYIIKNKLYI